MATGPLSLSEMELELLLDLLVRERKELPAEIHHTDGRDYRHRLEKRLDVVEDLIARLEAAAAVAEPVR